MNNSFNFLVKFKPVKQEVSRTVILTPMVSVLHLKQMFLFLETDFYGFFVFCCRPLWRKIGGTMEIIIGLITWPLSLAFCSSISLSLSNKWKHLFVAWKISFFFLSRIKITLKCKEERWTDSEIGQNQFILNSHSSSTNRSPVEHKS